MEQLDMNNIDSARINGRYITRQEWVDLFNAELKDANININKPIKIGRLDPNENTRTED